MNNGWTEEEEDFRTPKAGKGRGNSMNRDSELWVGGGSALGAAAMLAGLDREAAEEGRRVHEVGKMGWARLCRP